MLHSEINHFVVFLRSVIEAKSACLPFLDWIDMILTVEEGKKLSVLVGVY